MFKSNTTPCSYQAIILMLKLCHILSTLMVASIASTVECKRRGVSGDWANEVVLRNRREALKDEVIFSCEIHDQETSLNISLVCDQSLRCRLDAVKHGAAPSDSVAKRLPSLLRLSNNCGSLNKVIDKHPLSQNEIVDLTVNITHEAVFKPAYFCGLASVTNMTFNNIYYDKQTLGFGESCSSSSGCCVCNLKHLMVNFHSDRTTVIRNSFFCGMQNLTTLILPNSAITKIEDEAFLYLSSLERLELQNNRLVTLSMELFHSLKIALKYLDVSNNMLNSEILYTLQNLAVLEDVILDNNNIYLLHDDSFKGFQALKRLSLSNNKVKELGREFRYLTSLEELDMSANAITTMNWFAFNSLVNLSVLKLSGNRFSSIVDFISNDNFRLKVLDISLNDITAVPSKLTYFKNLTDLDLSHNKFDAITESDQRNLCKITNLRKLFLTNNSISTIYPGAFQCLDKLRTLSISNNSLTSIVAIKDSRVTHLYSRFNQILNISVDDFPPHLVHLDVSYNLLTEFYFRYGDEIDSKTGRRMMSDLQFLNLSQNSIQLLSIDECPRSAIMHNPMNGHHIYKNNCLPYIDLSFNYIQSICPFLMKMSRNRPMPTVNFNENELMCSCEMRYLRKNYNNDIKDSLSRVRLCCVEHIREACAGFSLGCLLGISEEPNLFAWHDRSLMTKKQFSCTSLIDEFPCNLHYDYFYICGLPCPDQCDCFITNQYDLYVIDCSYLNLISDTFPKHEQFNITTIVTFSYNQLSYVNAAQLSNYSNAIRLNLSNNNIKTIRSKSFRHFNQLEILILRHNQLSEISSKMFLGLEHLRHLDLSYNILTNIYQDAFLPLASVKTLNIRNNKLNLISISELKNLKSVVPSGIHLISNPWNCDDDVDFSFRCWFGSNSVLVNQPNSVKCFHNGTEVNLITFNNSNCYDSDPRVVDVTNSNVAVWSSTVSVVTFITALIIIMYLYRKEMQVLIYSRYGVRLFQKAEDVDVNKRYDVFISYSSGDEAFVVEQLLPGLEQIDNPYKVCIHERDLLAGPMVTENILEAVELSRRTLVVLSDNFVQSGFCRFEFRSAHRQMLSDRCARLIVILLGKIPTIVDPEMESYLKTNTYLKWGDRLFWEKLYFALPNRTR